MIGRPQRSTRTNSSFPARRASDRNGYGLMAGGAAEHIERAMPIFDALRPEGPREEGVAHAGPVGAGHFSKMVHNGIEYGLMQAYAEGFELLRSEEHTSELQPLLRLSYADFCLKQNKKHKHE